MRYYCKKIQQIKGFFITQIAEQQLTIILYSYDFKIILCRSKRSLCMQKFDIFIGTQ